MPDIAADLYAETMAALTAQRAAYVQYRTIIDGLRIALERPSRRAVPYLAEQLANTFAEIEEGWTLLLATRRAVNQDSEGPRTQELRAFSSLVLQDAALAQAGLQQLGPQLQARGADVRRELEQAFRPRNRGEAQTDLRVIDAQA